MNSWSIGFKFLWCIKHFDSNMHCMYLMYVRDLCIKKLRFFKIGKLPNNLVCKWNILFAIRNRIQFWTQVNLKKCYRLLSILAGCIVRCWCTRSLETKTTERQTSRLTSISTTHTSRSPWKRAPTAASSRPPCRYSTTAVKLHHTAWCKLACAGWLISDWRTSFFGSFCAG